MLRKQGVSVWVLLLFFLIPGSCVAQWATSGNNINNTNSGNVGVGTTAPTSLLDVTATNGNDGITIHGNNTNGPALKIQNSVTNGHEFEWISNGPVNNGGVGALQLFDNTDGATRLVVLPSSGNFGIGTTAPAALLDVTTSVGNDGINIQGTNNNGPALKINSLVTNGHEYEWISNGPVNNGGVGALQLFDNTDGATRLVVLPSSGNFGIGTTTPAQKLEVSGSIKMSAGSSGAIIFADGTTQSTATLIGPRGPQGATGATGPQGPPGPGSTSAVCFSVASITASSCSCNIRLVSQTLLNANTNGSCTATSNTGSCSASAFINGPVSATCCVCAPN